MENFFNYGAENIFIHKLTDQDIWLCGGEDGTFEGDDIPVKEFNSYKGAMKYKSSFLREDNDIKRFNINTFLK